MIAKPKTTVTMPKVLGATAVKLPKAKKLPGALAKPSKFYKGEESYEIKKPSIQKLGDFLNSVNSKQSKLRKYDFNEDYMSNDKKISAEEAAKAVLAKVAEMLQASSLAKAHEDRSKMSGKTGMVRGTTEANQNQKGVNQMGNNGSSGGMSEAGNNVRNASFEKHPEKSIANAKQIHKETLGELKAQPKPALTKDEPTADASSMSSKGIHKLSKFVGKMEGKKAPKAPTEGGI